MNTPHPHLQDFILFCIKQHGSNWPAIYDGIVQVAVMRLYKGMSYADLKKYGLSLASSDLQSLRNLVTFVAEAHKNETA
jgi:hypothetical protein